VVNVTDGTDVYVGLGPVKILFSHDYLSNEGNEYKII
jgi:hypothetical protein